MKLFEINTDKYYFTGDMDNCDVYRLTENTLEVWHETAKEWVKCRYVETLHHLDRFFPHRNWIEICPTTLKPVNKLKEAYDILKNNKTKPGSLIDLVPDGVDLLKEIPTGVKYDSGKVRLDLIPVEFTVGTGKALTFGANKYGQHNFRQGIDYQRLLGAAKRHIEAELAGIEQDRESGLEHWMHAAASLAMYAFMKKNRPQNDDRFKYTEEELKALEEFLYGKS